MHTYTIREESTLSSKPPWPGRSPPLSFTPAHRFATDSTKSPATHRKPSAAARPRPMSGGARQCGVAGEAEALGPPPKRDARPKKGSTRAVATLPTTLPPTPAQVLPGLMRCACKGQAGAQRGGGWKETGRSYPREVPSKGCRHGPGRVCNAGEPSKAYAANFLHRTPQPCRLLFPNAPPPTHTHTHTRTHPFRHTPEQPTAPT